jgi:hypothetical protein
MKRQAMPKVALGLFLLLLLFTTKINAAEINLLDYFLLKAGHWSRFTYFTPEFPDFTIKAEILTSGPFSGKYRVGDYVFPEEDRMTWRILSWDQTTAYIYATNFGVFNPPIALPLVYPTNTLIPHPFESGIYWYFRLTSSITVPAGTFNDVVEWFVLDSAYPPNSINNQAGLDVPYAVTGVDWYGRGVADLADMDVDAATGNVLYVYALHSTGKSGGGYVPPLLLD